MSDEKPLHGLFDEDLDLDAAIGENEREMRKAMGNDHFDQYMEFVAANRVNSVAFDATNVRRIGGVASLYESFAGLLPIVALLAIAWSIFFWVVWAIH